MRSFAGWYSSLCRWLFDHLYRGETQLYLAMVIDGAKWLINMQDVVLVQLEKKRPALWWDLTQKATVWASQEQSIISFTIRGPYNWSLSDNLSCSLLLCCVTGLCMFWELFSQVEGLIGNSLCEVCVQPTLPRPIVGSHWVCCCTDCRKGWL